MNRRSRNNGNTRRRTPTRTQTGILVKSKFEKHIGDSLTSRNVRYVYEKGLKVKYIVPEEVHEYTPDFKVRGRTWVVEAKGVLDAATRKKMIHVKNSNPELDIRLVFQRDNPIYKGSKTRYTDWARANGFPCAVGDIPQEWLDEEYA